MSKIVDTLLNNACLDTDLLVKNDAKGDDFSIPRDVDFFFNAPDEQKADVVASFINDNQYGTASIENIDETYTIHVVINLPPTQNIISSVSGLMACIGEIFAVEYTGWGTMITPGKTS